MHRPMFIIFCVLEAIVLSWAWAIFTWLWTTNAEFPKVSSYPLIDFAMKARVVGADQREFCSQSHQQIEKGHIDLHDELDRKANDAAIIKLMRDKMVVMRCSGTEKLISTTTSTPLQISSQGSTTVLTGGPPDGDLPENAGFEHDSQRQEQRHDST